MDLMQINNHNKGLIYNFQFSYSIFLFSLVFLIYSIILVDSVIISFAQNLSSSMSLKANAGADQYVEEGKQIILNAEDSMSSDPPIDSYNWFQIEPKSPRVVIENSNTSRASFTSPNITQNENFVFQLIVQDKNITKTDTVNIYVVEDLSSTFMPQFPNRLPFPPLSGGLPFNPSIPGGQTEQFLPGHGHPERVRPGQ